MKSVALAAALLATAVAQPVLAAGKPDTAGSCYTPTALEAEQAIRFVTDLMVVSTACQNTIYGEFRARNQNAIIGYQKAMIAHFHNSKGAFDSWNTSLANESSRRQNGVPTAQICQQAAEMLKQASALDSKGFHDLAVAKATTMSTSYSRCGK
ncbi:MAG: hypothetical protein JO267_09485 [Alphaproteobacteria bacterium]|nr:hypothetical protein [Alphaproteobacteria bacterium]